MVDNRDVRGAFRGFSRGFLEILAMKNEKEENLKAFNAILALLIYRIVLFPNIDNFMDQIVVEIFLSGNPIPFLLADIYYSLHERHEKKGGILLCCALLLHAWIMLHLKEEGSIKFEKLKWSQKLGSIIVDNVIWYLREWETDDIINSCRDFHNVPLWVTMGCINYNLIISLRYHGYPIYGPLESKALEPFFLHDLSVKHLIMRKVTRVWTVITRKGKEWGKRNTLVKEPYTQWVREKE